jgi:methylated-DNA-[protein]-cysteine S-methyltransferase
MNGTGYYASPIGDLEITSVDHKITGVRFLTSVPSEVNLTPAVEQCIAELEEYFLSGRKFFNVDLQISGSVFQNKVWSELLTIPYGKTISYLELALRIGDINSVRAVGLANGENALAIVVPCHRVIGKNGDLIGYGGGLNKKIWLLEHEGAFAEQLKLFQ